MLRDRVGAAHGRRSRIVEPADRVDVVFDPIASIRLDQHDRTVLSHCGPGISHRIDGPAHVVQAVKEADEIVAVPGIFVGVCDLEADALCDAGFSGHSAGDLNRFLMGIEAPEAAFRVCLGHQHGRVAMPAADIGDLGTLFEFGRDA